jgi:hypothetical protein
MTLLAQAFFFESNIFKYQEGQKPVFLLAFSGTLAGSSRSRLHTEKL